MRDIAGLTGVSGNKDNAEEAYRDAGYHRCYGEPFLERMRSG